MSRALWKTNFYRIAKFLFIFLFMGILFFGVTQFFIRFPSNIKETHAAYMAFTSSSTGFTFVVPNVVGHASSSPVIKVKCWGGGGGGGGGGNATAAGAGGGGGFAESEIRVLAGDSLTVFVGGFGGKGINNASSATDDGGGGGAGGYSGVQTGATFLIQCGGGGGGGSSSAANEIGGDGGAGGGGDAKPGVRGLNAACGSGVGAGGFGATTAAVGAASDSCSTGANGSAGSGASGGAGGGTTPTPTNAGGTGGKNGGASGGGSSTANAGGGGGGGGAFGGGGGEQSVAEGAGGGGGGSSLLTGVNAFTDIGTSTTPGYSGDSFQPANAGVGGAGGATDSTGTDGNDGSVVFIYSDGLSQVSYRWFSNLDSTAVGTGAPLNSPMIAPTPGNPFRLRLLLLNNSTSSPIAANGTTTQLQFAEKSGECDLGFEGESYADISDSTAIAFYNNPTPSDNAALTENNQDPKFFLATSSPKVVNQAYEESGTFTNSQADIGGGWGALWDFALVDNNAARNTSYCFRAMQASGSNRFELEGGYLVLPEIVTSQDTRVRLRGEIRLRNVRLF